jgi:hypothetical protein
MNIAHRVKGLLLAPEREWEIVEAERKSASELYREYFVYLALIPPFAGFLGGYLFGFVRGPADVVHLSLLGGLLRAALQYLLTLPMLYLVAFVVSSIAPHFEGKSNDARALALVGYSCTPAWLAALFGLAPGLRWLDILGLYGLYVFYFGLPRMMRCPKDHADVFTLAVLVIAIAAGALHAWIVHLAAPWQAFSS